MNQPLLNHPTIQKILDHYKTIWALNHLSHLASWDVETYMPEAGATGRGVALGKAQSLIQKLVLEPEFVNQAKSLQGIEELNDWEQGVVRVVNRMIDQYQKLPASFVEKWALTTNQAQVAWRNAKQTNNFTLFRPHLEKIVDLSIQRADYYGYTDSSYDALLDEFEEGSRTAQVELYFKTIRPFLTSLLQRITKSTQFISTHPLEQTPYLRNSLEKFNQEMLSFLGQDPRSLRLDISAHPFTQNISSQDVRITTWYHSHDFAASILATIHEFGHALYELHGSPELEYTPICGGASLGIHESQSRFWENFVGRSQAFIHRFYPQMQALGVDIHKSSEAEIYRYFNTVKPGLKRVEADEVTYHFHIMIRYELEKALITKQLKVADLPEAWNAKYKEYLGVEPKTFSEGVLQDIHWSMGAIGYFPTYSTGTVLSATWKKMLEKELGTIDSLIEANQIETIQTWLKDHIHQFGSTYTFNQLVEKETGTKFDAQPWMEYLESKYRLLYP